jgi:HEAT repeat protein
METYQAKIEALFTQLAIKNEEIRALGPEAVPVLIQLFDQETSENQEWKRRVILSALGVLGSDAAVTFLIQTAENGEVAGWLRRKAVEALGRTRHPDALVYLIGLTIHPHARVRDAAVLALGYFDDPTAQRALVRVTAEEVDENIRARAERLLRTREVSPGAAALRVTPSQKEQQRRETPPAATADAII